MILVKIEKLEIRKYKNIEIWCIKNLKKKKSAKE